MMLSTKSSFESVPAFSFTMVSSFSSPFNEGSDEKTCALPKSSMGSPFRQGISDRYCFVDAFVERADGNSSGSSEQGKADIIAAQAEGTGGRLVIFDGQYRNLRFPVGGDKADFWCISMMVRALSASWCRTAGSGPRNCASMGYFLNIRLYLFNLMYASG